SREAHIVADAVIADLEERISGLRAHRQARLIEKRSRRSVALLVVLRHDGYNALFVRHRAVVTINIRRSKPPALLVEFRTNSVDPLVVLSRPAIGIAEPHDCIEAGAWACFDTLDLDAACGGATSGQSIGVVIVGRGGVRARITQLISGAP